MALFKSYKFYCFDGHKFEVLAASLKDAIEDGCFIEQIQEHEIRLIEVIE